MLCVVQSPIVKWNFETKLFLCFSPLVRNKNIVHTKKAKAKFQRAKLFTFTHTASFWLKMMFIFSNTSSIFKVMRQNRHLTKFDMLTSSSSNMTDQTLLMNEHLKKINTQYFYFHFANFNCKVIVSHFILEHQQQNNLIWNLQKIYLLNNFILYILNLHKSGQKLIFLKSLPFYETNLML